MKMVVEGLRTWKDDQCNSLARVRTSCNILDIVNMQALVDGVDVGYSSGKVDVTMQARKRCPR